MNRVINWQKNGKKPAFIFSVVPGHISPIGLIQFMTNEQLEDLLNSGSPKRSLQK
jgi:hypothetical protein